MNNLINFSDFDKANEAVEIIVNEEIVRLNEELETLVLESEDYELVNEGLVKQIIGWLFLPQLTLLNVLRQYTLKKIKIKRMLAQETDPAKKENLRQELKKMKYEEVKAKEKVQKIKKDNEAKANAAKSKNMSPEDRAAYNAQKAKMKAKLDKAEADLRKVQGEYNGLV